MLSGAALFLDKGYALAIEAMRLVAATRDVAYVVAGAGDDATGITALAERAGIRVHFTGQLDQEDWFAALNAADVVLHPTPGELFPNIVAEAMLLGRALVALDSGATPEILGEGGAALMVPEGDTAAMASAVLTLLTDASRREIMGSAGRDADHWRVFRSPRWSRAMCACRESRGSPRAPARPPVRPSARLEWEPRSPSWSPSATKRPALRTSFGPMQWADEIIVADNGSVDDTAARARAAGAKVIDAAGLTIAGARNAGADAARHDWILALDTDERVTPAAPGRAAPTSHRRVSQRI